MNALDALVATLPAAEPSVAGNWLASQIDDRWDSLAGYRPPVGDSDDLKRVEKLPRRPQVDLGPLSADAAALVDLMNGRLRRPDWRRTDCRCAEIAPERTRHGGTACILDLRSAQAWAIYEAGLLGGIYGLLAVGVGKTGVGILVSLVVPGVKLAVLFVPPNLVDQLAREYELWREHWRVPNLMWGSGVKKFFHRGSEEGVTLHVVPYSRLSQPTSTTLLRDLKPDLILADEADKLANLDSARGGRFDRAFAEVPDTKFCGWTGTTVDKSVTECAHLLARALRRGSPLPLDAHQARQWALAVDPGPRPAGPGSLVRMGLPGEEIRSILRRRLVETPGVVATREGAVTIPLEVRERVAPAIPDTIAAMLAQVRKFERPDGEELVDVIEVQRVVSQVACGFYYRWVFPDAERGPDGKVTEVAREAIELWFARRKAWRKELRGVLLRRAEHLDSERLCSDAADRWLAGYEGDLPTWETEHRAPWLEVEDSVPHEVEAVWVDDFLARDAAEWAIDHRGVVWYGPQHVAFGTRVAAIIAERAGPHRFGSAMHGGGPTAEQRIFAETGDRSIVASIKSHGRGRDGLQYLFSEQLHTHVSPSGRVLEQLFARLHRVGQRAPRVVSEFYQHVPELRAALKQAARRAEFAAETWGASQKLLEAECDVDLGEEDEW